MEAPELQFTLSLEGSGGVNRNEVEAPELQSGERAFRPAKTASHIAGLQRVAKKVEEKFGTMPAEVPEFDHYVVSEFLIKNLDDALAKMPDLDAALDRFENIFKLLNGMLPAKVRAVGA